jgi:hypothetical protein
MKEDFSNWSLGEVIDRMIRIRTAERQTVDAQKEYVELVKRLDKVEEMIKSFVNSQIED